MNKKLYLLNNINELHNYLGSILKFDSDNSEIMILVRDRRLNLINMTNNILESLLFNTKVVTTDYHSLTDILNIYQPDIVLCPHKNSINEIDTEITNNLYFSLNTQQLTHKDFKILMHCNNEDINCESNTFIDTSEFINRKYELLELMGISFNKEKGLASEKLNGLKCSVDYAEAFEEMNFNHNIKINDKYFKHSNNYYKISCYNQNSIKELVEFESFLQINRRENPNETVGDFYKSFTNKQTNSTNTRYIFILKTLDNKIIGTRTIEDAYGSLELKDFKERELDLFTLSNKYTSSIKITGDLLLCKNERGKGLGKKLIEITNDIAFKYDWDLFGSTCWDDTKLIYESIGINIINQVDKSIKYQWVNENRRR